MDEVRDDFIEEEKEGGKYSDEKMESNFSLSNGVKNASKNCRYPRKIITLRRISKINFCSPIHRNDLICFRICFQHSFIFAFVGLIFSTRTVG